MENLNPKQEYMVNLGYKGLESVILGNNPNRDKQEVTDALRRMAERIYK